MVRVEEEREEKKDGGWKKREGWRDDGRWGDGKEGEKRLKGRVE